MVIIPNCSRIGSDLALIWRYFVLEHAEFCKNLRSLLPAKNVRFLNVPLAGLKEHLPPGSVDYFIASGVLPHVSHDLDAAVSEIARYIRDGGTLHIVSSYFGFDKGMGQVWKDAVDARPGLSEICAVMCALLQMICCASGSGPRSFFIRNFQYSFQKRPRHIYRQFLEYFYVTPYELLWDYNDYLRAINNAGLGLTALFPHSIALQARKGVPGQELLCPLPAGARLAILGDDWSGAWVARRLGLDRTHVVATMDQAANYDAVVIAYDYTCGIPYFRVARALMDKGFILGRNLYLFQMLIDRCRR
ncbi:hypothetical protein WCLP8_3220005 [uncultured Gammaproteobacteria bacterium]|nr:class I SAM-dependent methyltransferase [Pseudomonadota bacterium]